MVDYPTPLTRVGTRMTKYVRFTAGRFMVNAKRFADIYIRLGKFYAFGSSLSPMQPSLVPLPPVVTLFVRIY